jgi:ketosteroid isomerase-like protein
MDNSNNLQTVQRLYQSFASGDQQALMGCFDPAVVWLEPGTSAIPFSGTFEGLEGLGKMFTLEAANLQVKNFVPKTFFTNADQVVVLGSDVATAKSTGKTYSTDWVQAFTLSNGKIIRAQVYMDTQAIAQAFQP